jgi:hypothetical protein
MMVALSLEEGRLLENTRPPSGFPACDLFFEKMVSDTMYEVKSSTMAYQISTMGVKFTLSEPHRLEIRADET